MESFDSLLTCCICLDRYRNPKLLPCQHTFCMEPCMEGLIDYVKRQVKCPECRAEHRIPYKGIQEFPSNVTMQRFLDMYSTISGELPDPTQGQVMERCQVCNEKEYLSPCAHCDKKVCPDCKSAHIDVLKRELTRINAQVRRGLHRLSDIHSAAEKNASTVQQNCIAVREEVENIGQRLIKAIRDRTDYLKSEVDSHMATEVRNLNQLKDNLETEIANIESNSELAEKHMNDNTEWDDAELVDAKDIFLKTVEFIRNFEHDAPAGGDFRRPIRFTAAQDPHSLSKTLECFGELNINKQPAIMDGSQQYGGGAGGGFPALMPPGSSAPGLMRSKSDHRLVAALRQQEERGGYGAYGDESGRSSPVARRRFGERPPRKESDAGLYGADDSAYDSPCERRHKYRSRFTRRNLDPDDDLESYRPEPHAPAEAPKEKKKERERVLDTDDATKGPLSGIARICDVPRVIQKVVESERVPKKKKEEPKKEPAAAPAPAPAAPTPAPAPWRRQKSEDDEIAKIKKMNKEADARCTQGGTAAAAAAAAATASAAETPAPTPAPPRAPSQPKGPESRRTSQTTAPPPTPPASAAARPRPPREETAEERRANRQMASADAISAWVNEPFETPGSVQARRKEPAPATPPAPTESAPRTPLRTAPASSQPRSGSTSSESSEAASRTPASSAPAKTSTTPASAATPSTPPVSSSAATAVTSSATPATPSTPATPATPTTPSRPPFKSRFLGRAPTPRQDSTQDDDESSSSEETDSESETESSSEESSEEEDSAPVTTRPRPAVANSPAAAAVKTSLGPLLARSAHARGGSDDATTSSVTSRQPRPATGYGSQRGTDDYSPGATATSSASTYGNRYGTTDTTAAEPKPYESRFNSRYGDHGLARSRTSSALDARPAPPAEDTYAAYAAKFSRPRATYNDEYATPSSATTTSPRYSSTTPSYSSRFLNRSKSSAALDALEDAPRPTAGDEAASSPASAVAGGGRTDGTSRYAPSIGERRSWLARSGSSEQTDERGSSGGGGSSPSASLRSSVQRQASGDSGATSGEQGEAAPTAAGSRSEALSSWAQYLKNKYGYRNSKDGSTSSSVGKALTRSKSSHLMRLPGELFADEETAPEAHPAAPCAAPSGTLLGPRSQYLQKGRLRFKLGTRGGGPGCFTWPRGIAVGPDNSIVVADSSNHRVQVFDQNGNFVKEFGQYGNGEAEFDCLAGVSVNRIGQFIISDRYNHRIQIFDPSGRFLRSFGANGTMEGRFNYPWGVTTDALGFIYVCDKENHRVQVFQSDGTFVGTIGSEGRDSGQLAHPHYIAVSSTNRVVVTDSNNHRVQVFDVNGRCLTTFGGEGGEEGKFKFPRGVAVDDEGYIIVGDSGNNRIQVFEPDGTFLKAFGNWGSQDGEFKGLEGVAVMSNGYILVCDRENHRVQVF